MQISARASLPDFHGAVLVASAPVVSALSPGQVREFHLTIGGGFRIELDQGDADFQLEFLDSGAKVVRTVDAFGWLMETATFAPGTTVQRLRIRRANSEKHSAKFTVRLVELPDFSSQDTIRARAEDATTSARALFRDAHDIEASRAAITAARHAVELWRDAGDVEAQLRTSLLLADALNSSAGDFAEASRVYRDALTASRSLRDLRTEAEALNNLGVSLRRQSLFNQALDDLHEALQSWKRLAPQTGYAACLNNLALTEFEVAEYESALSHFSEALRVESTLGIHDGDPFIFNNKALVEGALGEWAASIRSFEHASAGFESRGDALAAGRALSNSARMYLRVGNTLQAQTNVRRGLAMISRAGDEHARAESLNLLGEVYIARSEIDKALDTLHQALDLSRQIGDRRAEANGLISVGLALTAISGRGAAAEYLEDALAIFRRIGTPASQASILYHLALIRRDLGQLDRASEAATEAVAIAETIRANVAAERLRVSFLASTHDYYSALIDILMQKGLTVQAWETAERARARVLLETVGGGHASELERELTYELNSESLRLMRDSPDAESVRKRVDALTAELSRTGHKNTGLAYSQVPSLGDVQEWLGESTALIEYSVSDFGGYAWVVTKTSLKSFHLPGSRAIQVSARLVASLMESKRADLGEDSTFRKATQHLSAAAMISALTTNLHVQRLVIVPDGPLEFVPFELLPVSTTPTLLDKYEVIESPSAAVALALTRRREQRRAAAQNGVLLVADPVFDADDPRLAAPVSTSHEPARFSRLAFSRREAQMIATLRQASPITMLLDFDASKEAFTSGYLAEYGILHISTHGVGDHRDAIHSGLVLSLVDRNGSPRDGILSVTDVTALQLNANIVVLNACDSALGERFAGEGPLSLARAFLYAGANRVIATRWQIDDEASAALLTAFYRSLWRDGLAPSGALREAQLTIRSDPRWRSPFYWASFVLQGEP